MTTNIEDMSKELILDIENESGVLSGGSHLLVSKALHSAYERGKADAVPEGWVVVPETATPVMLDPVEAWFNHPEDAAYCYKAMLAARPPLLEVKNV